MANAKIVIVNDNPETLMLLSLLVKDVAPCETTSTNNPFEAVELVRGGGVDIVISELRMPGLNGIELLDALRNIDADIPVIITSDYGSVETAAEAMRAGAFDFMIRPLRKERLLFALHNASEFRKLRQENRALASRVEGVSAEL